MKVEDLLPKERIAVCVEATDWEAAVRALGQLMVDTGVVEERYIEAMINTTKELGPYIVIAPGVAIPHARPEDGVIKPSLAFAKLSTPVEFGNKDNDPVSLLFGLGAVDHDQHVLALQTIAEILMDESKFQDLMNAETVKDVSNTLYE